MINSTRIGIIRKSLHDHSTYDLKIIGLMQYTIHANGQHIFLRLLNSIRLNEHFFTGHLSRSHQFWLYLHGDRSIPSRSNSSFIFSFLLSRSHSFGFDLHGDRSIPSRSTFFSLVLVSPFLISPFLIRIAWWSINTFIVHLFFLNDSTCTLFRFIFLSSSYPHSSCCWLHEMIFDYMFSVVNAWSLGLVARSLSNPLSGNQALMRNLIVYYCCAYLFHSRALSGARASGFANGWLLIVVRYGCAAWGASCVVLYRS